MKKILINGEDDFLAVHKNSRTARVIVTTLKCLIKLLRKGEEREGMTQYFDSELDIILGGAWKEQESIGCE